MCRIHTTSMLLKLHNEHLYIDRIEKIKQEKDTILFPNPKRCKNLWREGNPTSSNVADLGDYSLVTNINMEDA